MDIYIYKSVWLKKFFSQRKHMLWVIKRTISVRHFIEHPKHVKNNEKNIHNFTLKNFGYLYLCSIRIGYGINTKIFGILECDNYIGISISLQGNF